MTDLLRVLPHFAVGQYASLLPVLEKHALTTSDLLTLDPVDIGKRTHLPLLDLKRLCATVLNALHADLGVLGPSGQSAAPSSGALKQTAASLAAQWQTISTLDATLDSALGGGIPAGYVTEITGESGAGKTQFLLTLLLAVQLPPPHGLGRPALYISTEAPLSTRRLSQMLAAHPLLRSVEPPAPRPSLDNIISTATPDLESQDHILTFQVPVEIERRNIGLLVLDSVAANFRAEFERSAGTHQQHGSNMGARSTELVRLGMQLRDLARKYNLAVVVANQVADRFGGGSKTPVSSFRHQSQSQPPQNHPHHQFAGVGSSTQESPLATRSKRNMPGGAGPAIPAVEPSSSLADIVPRSSIPEPRPPSGAPAPPALLLDHQQRWFTGWGDDPDDQAALKTPSLGLVWSTQIAARIALYKRPAYGNRLRHHSRQRLDGSDDDGDNDDDDEDKEDDRSRLGMPALHTWRRWMKVVFAPHAPASAPGLDGAVEFQVTMAGVKAVAKD
ncbi:DNA repair protein RAD57 [Lasiosphaeria ovina]|uniref:DNA repair protein RAD57 n=1 Tax=Lasiosphaeria ovina TaxID=92902 RepID=A0AAE0K7H9_9PEZI|nr:DNA repair protein RAD57 [Lasiosphaeria ovina]